jgi:hypothetical protein
VHRVSTRPPPAPRVSRLEAWILLASLAVISALAVTGIVAILPRGVPSPDADAGPGNPNAAYQAEQPVDAWHAGRWYPAHVHSADAGRYFITYDDFSVSWHEWVTARRLRQRQ